jgi:hypothetical protein
LFSCYKKSTATVNRGKLRKRNSKIISAKSSGIKSSRLKKMRSVFIKIPIPIENPTSPRRYSFLMGWKNVWISKGNEKNRKKA